LHPFAEPTPVGPGGSLGDSWTVEPWLAELAPMDPESELAPEPEELAELEWVLGRPLAPPVRRSLARAVTRVGVDPARECDRCRAVVATRLTSFRVRVR